MQQPVQYAGAILIADESMQDGSRFSFGPIPAVMAVEEAAMPSGDRFLIYVIDTPIGRQRFAFQLEAVRDHHRMLGELLDKPNLLVTREMPRPVSR